MTRPLTAVTCAWAIGCGTDAPPPVTADDAQAFATTLVAALDRCDQAVLDTMIDPRRFAVRAGASRTDRFAADVAAAWATLGPCSRDYRYRFSIIERAMVDRARPLLRYERVLGPGEPGRGPDVDTVGYLELHLDHAPGKPVRLIDLGTPLRERTLVAELRLVQDNVRERDQAAMISDTIGFLVEGVQPAWPQLRAAVPREPGRASSSSSSTDLGLAIKAGFVFHDLPAVDHALDQLDHIIGPDPVLTDLRAASALVAGHPDAALELAKEATLAWPEVADTWITRMFAEVGSHDLAAAMTSVQTLTTKFSFPATSLREAALVDPLTSSDEFRDRYLSPVPTTPR